MPDLIVVCVFFPVKQLTNSSKSLMWELTKISTYAFSYLESDARNYLVLFSVRKGMLCPINPLTSLLGFFCNFLSSLLYIMVAG